MRRIVYLVLFVGVVLGIVNLTLTNSLASEGESFRSTMNKREEKIQEISQLRQSVMEAQSIERIIEKANALGLIETVRQVKGETAD